MSLSSIIFLKGSAVSSVGRGERHLLPTVTLGLATWQNMHVPGPSKSTRLFLKGRLRLLCKTLSYDTSPLTLLPRDCVPLAFANSLPTSLSFPGSESPVGLDRGLGSRAFPWPCQPSLPVQMPLWVGCCPWLSTLHKSNCLCLFQNCFSSLRRQLWNQNCQPRILL